MSGARPFRWLVYRNASAIDCFSVPLSESTCSDFTVLDPFGVWIL